MIAEASPSDADSILSVINTSNREAFRCIIPKEHFKSPVLSLEEMRRLLRRMTFYLYRHAGQVVGVAALSVEEEDEGRIHWVYILSEFQRKRIGTALVEHIEAQARKQGLRQLKLHTTGTALWAIEFYQKLGYRLVGKVDHTWGFDVVMKKELVGEAPSMTTSG